METKSKCCGKAKDATCSSEKEMKEHKSECKTDKCETGTEHKCH